MKINSIKYCNYRCFLDAEVIFTTSEDKNISMVVAHNGGGKTEMLFSFIWVLYGSRIGGDDNDGIFDFSSLKGKENTAYSLNSDIFHELERCPVGDKRECSVELKFEDNGVNYVIKRTGIFTKARNGVSRNEAVELSTTDVNGVLQLPCRDKDVVRRKLGKVITESILNGIAFDGERMKKLSHSENDSKKAVEGVIKHITNEALFEICFDQFKDKGNRISREIRNLGRTSSSDNVANLEEQIQSLKEEKETKENLLKIKRSDLKEINDELAAISDELIQHQDSKMYENQRIILRKELEEVRQELISYTEQFQKDLDDGFIFATEELLNAVEKEIEDYDVPVGLTVDAVKSILKRDTCICGNPLSDKEREALTELLTTLPPDNINSNLSEMIRSMRMVEVDVENKLNRTFKEIRDRQKKEDSLVKQIAEIAVKISSDAPARIKELEERNGEKMQAKGVVLSNIETLEGRITEIDKLVENLRKKRDAKAESDELLNKLSKKERFVEKCKKAIDRIKEYNMLRSLSTINTNLDEAYRILSEDYERGYRLYIVEFDKDKKFSLITYSAHEYQKRFNESESERATWKQMGMSDNQIRERVILDVAGSGSTGQGKINSLAFAKAILDYSNAPRDNESIEIAKSYPFLIDSPFTELDGQNLILSATNISSFAEQVLLFISVQSLEGVKDIIMPHVGSQIRLTKKDDANYSFIEKED